MLFLPFSTVRACVRRRPTIASEPIVKVKYLRARARKRSCKCSSVQLDPPKAEKLHSLYCLFGRPGLARSPLASEEDAVLAHQAMRSRGGRRRQRQTGGGGGRIGRLDEGGVAQARAKDLAKLKAGEKRKNENDPLIKTHIWGGMFGRAWRAYASATPAE